ASSIVSCDRDADHQNEIIVLDIIKVLKPFELALWFALTIISMTVTTYMNVSFFSTITMHGAIGIKFLLLLLIFENITSYCRLKQSLAKKTFVLDFIKHFQTTMNQRILSANWIVIKVSDQVEIRRKIEEASTSIQALIEDCIDKVTEVSKFLMAIITILYICPLAAIFIGIAYASFYRLYLYKKSNELLAIKLKMIDRYDKLSGKYSRANENMFEYVIHHEKNKIIDITNELKIDMERQWFTLDYLYDNLSFNENILGKMCTFLTIIIHLMTMGTSGLIIPLYHYLSSLIDSIQEIVVFYIRCLRLIKDYDVVKPILEQYEERINAEQYVVNSELQIQDLQFKYKGTREAFILQLDGTLTFKHGEVILITGKSGAGKSTFYDILSGSIPMSSYECSVHVDGSKMISNFHNVEYCRTMVLQDTDMDYRSTIYSMITDIDDDDVPLKKTSQLDNLVWEFLQLVKIDDFIREELNCDLDQPMENKLSGGQKTRLLLARALFRAHHRQSSLLILDEPDKGLPAETTVGIIENIMKWYKPRGVLLLTLHTEQAHNLNFDQILHVENGKIMKVK
ncbi:unnamed protein product, partial [Didymodactylos carnosus]